GGITDYHLHLDYAAMPEGLVLYPHFASQVVPGWLDKALKHRHRATAALDNLVVLAPAPEWVAGLPGGKLPDRSDFRRFGDDEARRMAVWRRALAESRRLADEFADAVARGGPIEARPL
ncbi:MAG: phospholipase, partial [Pseudomonadota bacterium]